MAFQRAQWHSGLTYRQTCRNCSKIVEYTDYSLDFRPWYADGFVYCPNCKTPLRHNENLAIDAPTPAEQEEPIKVEEPAKVTVVADVAPEVVDTASEAPAAGGFCTQCGKKSNPGDRFCAGCGSKLA